MKYPLATAHVHSSKTGARILPRSLLPGEVRIFIKTKEQPATEGEPSGEGVAFTGEDMAVLTPVDRELKLSIGQSRDVKASSRAR